MPIITITFKDKKIKDYPLAVGQTCTIGRKSSNDIVIDNLAVSGKHARIESVSTTFVIRDLDSTNGTFVNKKKVSMHNLRHKDVLLIGKHELIFDRSDLMNKKSGADDLDDDKTRLLDTSEYRTLIHAEKERAGMKQDSEQSSPSLFKRIINWFFG
ncbi:MAG: pSer/pThr/pTyr-binding forkhead associated (FHA) protein [Desulforhopalus sp.]|jgi:pSer/pThr/pTyr-binding forkhead associated (FHA) protein